MIFVRQLFERKIYQHQLININLSTFQHQLWEWEIIYASGGDKRRIKEVQRAKNGFIIFRDHQWTSFECVAKESVQHYLFINLNLCSPDRYRRRLFVYSQLSTAYLPIEQIPSLIQTEQQPASAWVRVIFFTETSSYLPVMSWSLRYSVQQLCRSCCPSCLGWSCACKDPELRGDQGLV